MRETYPEACLVIEARHGFCRGATERWGGWGAMSGPPMSLDRERELLGHRPRPERTRAAVGDAEPRLERGHRALHRLGRRAPGIRPAIERQVARHQLGPVAREVLHEMLARDWPELVPREDVAPDVGRPGVA